MKHTQKITEDEITVKSKSLKDYPRGTDFKKEILDLQSPEELLKFIIAHEFIAEEILLFTERVNFICGKITREIATDKVLEELAMIIRVIFIMARSFDQKISEKKYEEMVKKTLYSRITGINALVEYRANEIFDLDHLISVYGNSLDPQKITGPIMKKIKRLMEKE